MDNKDDDQQWQDTFLAMNTKKLMQMQKDDDARKLRHSRPQSPVPVFTSGNFANDIDNKDYIDDNFDINNNNMNNTNHNNNKNNQNNIQDLVANLVNDHANSSDDDEEQEMSMQAVSGSVIDLVAKGLLQNSLRDLNINNNKYNIHKPLYIPKYIYNPLPSTTTNINININNNNNVVNRPLTHDILPDPYSPKKHDVDNRISVFDHAYTHHFDAQNTKNRAASIPESISMFVNATAASRKNTLSIFYYDHNNKKNHDYNNGFISNQLAIVQDDIEENDDDNKINIPVIAPSTANVSSVQSQMSSLFKDIMIDRNGFPVNNTNAINPQQHRLIIRREQELILQWQNILFPANKKLQINWNKKNDLNRIRQLIIKKGGIPQAFRSFIWPKLCGNIDIIKNKDIINQSLYNNLVTQHNRWSDWDELIWKDIHRTFRSHLRFGAKTIASQKNLRKNTKFRKNLIQINTKNINNSTATSTQLALFNVLSVFGSYNKSNNIGYCQGMQLISALLLMYMSEEDVFWCLNIISKISKYGPLSSMWNMDDILLRFYQFECCFNENVPKLYQHLIKYDINDVSMYGATTWFVTIFVSQHGIGFDTILRIWDIYLIDGINSIFKFGCGYLKYFEKKLLKINDFELLLESLTNGWKIIAKNSKYLESFIKISMNNIKITEKHLQKWTKQYYKNKKNQKK